MEPRQASSDVPEQVSPRAEGAPRHTPRRLHEGSSARARAPGAKGETAKLSPMTTREDPETRGRAVAA